MIANIPIPQRIQNQLQGEFYPLQKPELLALKEAKLINNTAFVHLALRCENPFCDRPIQINPKEFSLAWNIPESSVYEAIGKLKKLGILLFKKGKVMIEWVVDSFSNSQVHSQQEEVDENPDSLWDSRENSEIPEKILRSQKKLRDSRKNSEIPETQELKDIPSNKSSLSQTSQTIQTSHTLQIGDEKKAQTTTNIDNGGLDKTNILKGEVNKNDSSLVEEKRNFPQGNNSPGGSIEIHNNNPDSASNIVVSQNKPVLKSYNPQAVVWKWLPDGPWVVDGKLDVNFQEWLAKKWVIKYGDDIYEAKANVLSYFRNDPVKLAVRWEQYQKEYIAKAENIKTRLDHGCKITPEQKQEAIAHRNAIKPLSPSQQQTSRSSELGIRNSEFGIESNQNPANQLTASQNAELLIAEDENNQLPASNNQSPVNKDELPASQNSGSRIAEDESNQLPANSAEVFEAEVISDFWAETEETNSEPISTNIPDDVDWEEIEREAKQKAHDVEQEYYQEINLDNLTTDENGKQDLDFAGNKSVDEILPPPFEEQNLNNSPSVVTDNRTTEPVYSPTEPVYSPTTTDKYGWSVRSQDVTGIASFYEKEVNEEQRKKVGSMMKDFLNSFKQKKAEAMASDIPPSPPDAFSAEDLKLLNQDLGYLVIRQDSMTKHIVQKWLDAGYSCDYDFDGNPCFVYNTNE